MTTPAAEPRRTNFYGNPEFYKWLDSYEGIPEWTDPAETVEEKAGWARWHSA